MIQQLTIELKPYVFPYTNDFMAIKVSVLANGVVIYANEEFYKQNDFAAIFPYLMKSAEQTILEQVKKLDAIEWDKQKIRDMEV